MGTQRTFAGLAWSQKGKVTRRERFLAEMDAVIPWARLVALIAPSYPKAGQGRQPLGLEKMLRIYCLQQWFNLSDPQAEDAIYDSESMRRFAGVELSEDVVPLLQEQRLLLQAGTIVDATIIAAPSSTKNARQARDPEMKQTKKGNTWYFGMKVHVGTDPRGLVHSLTTTDAAQADVSQLPALLHGRERALYGDRAYWSQGWRRAFGQRGVRYRVNRRGTRGKPLSARWQAINRSRSRVRARGEHALPRRQAAVGLRQGTLPGVGEEHGAGLRALRAGQPLPGAPPAEAGRGDVSPVAATPAGRSAPGIRQAPHRGPLPLS